MVVPERLSRTAAAEILNEANEIVLSAASAWEIATKVRLRKLPWAERLERDLLSAARRAGYLFEPIHAEVALRAGRLPGKHKDPFDRIIAAHSLAKDIPVLSADAQLDAFGIRRIW